MSRVSELLAWQWRGYATYHRDRRNLLVHIVAVPLFLAASVLLALGVVRLSAAPIVGGLVGVALSVMVQARGHRLERTPPAPFTGPANLIGRLVLEQWVTFPRFVVTGAWWRSFRAAPLS